jgi:hypothetical protein
MGLIDSLSETILFEKHLGRIGAELHNLLKLFEWLVEGGSAPAKLPIPSVVQKPIIY